MTAHASTNVRDDVTQRFNHSFWLLVWIDPKLIIFDQRLSRLRRPQVFNRVLDASKSQVEFTVAPLSYSTAQVCENFRNKVKLRNYLLATLTSQNVRNDNGLLLKPTTLRNVITLLYRVCMCKRPEWCKPIKQDAMSAATWKFRT